MRISVNDTIFDIEDKYVEYSPLLSAMQTSLIPIERDEEGNIYIDADPEHFNEYAKFLQGSDFHMDEEIEALFDYMGHSNYLKYPISVWTMKLKDNWIRDNFHRLELWRNPLYGLVQIPLVRQCPVPIPEGWYVAGGAALWMAGKIDKLADIDLFTSMSKEEAVKSLQFLNDIYMDGSRETNDMYRVSVSGNSISYMYEGTDEDGNTVRKKVQFILRLYKSPSETVHGFDLDCVGAVYLPPGFNLGNNHVSMGTMWCTQRTMMSLDFRMNWFDPRRASPSYAYRLVKYRNRGFHIFLPLITRDKIDEEKVRDYFNYIHEQYRSYCFEQKIDYGEPYQVRITPRKMFEKVKDVIRKSTNKRGMIMMSADSLLNKISSAVFDGESTRPIHQMFSYSRRSITAITDPASLLILTVFYDLYVLPHSNPVVDYECSKRSKSERSIGRNEYFDNDGNFIVNFSLLQWKEQNPMEQVSSTCNPTPIGDLREWYMTSPFHRNYAGIDVIEALDISVFQL